MQSIAIGGSATSPTNAIGSNDIAIGSEANASNTFSVAVGPLSKASGSASVALGFHSEATELSATALGDDTHATHYNSTAIGVGAKTTAKNQIVLGRTSETVYIPGNLVVGGSSAIGINGNSHVFLNVSDGQAGDSIGIVQVCSNNDYLKAQDKEKTADGVGATYSQAISWFSDRRLKNVGEKYTAGLAELKKLDFFHYTFKKDEEKTPHVGVIAQDLQKVFPDAVTKGEDGYLRIRFEDMFYAVINAVKELDNKISEIVQNITDINSTIEKQNKTIEEQQKTINELLKRVEKLEKAG